MLDLKLLRDRPDEVRQALARRGAERLLDDVLAADAHRRELVKHTDQLKHDHNAISRRIGKASAEDREALLDRAR